VPTVIDTVAAIACSERLMVVTAAGSGTWRRYSCSSKRRRLMNSGDLVPKVFFGGSFAEFICQPNFARSCLHT
jgi:hypothetical protein